MLEFIRATRLRNYELTASVYLLTASLSEEELKQADNYEATLIKDGMSIEAKSQPGEVPMAFHLI